jgi:ketosteroid isomerase-like protein
MRAELEALNERWNKAWLQKDVATVERLMAADYVYVAQNGQALDRGAVLAIIRSPGYKLHHGTRTEVIVRPIGADAAIVRHRWQGEGVFEGNPFKDDHTCVMLCARTSGAWQIVFEQCTANSR